MNSREKLKKLISADANPTALVDAVKRKDASYIRGALQWYERQGGKTLLVDFLKKAYAACRTPQPDTD